MLLTVFVATPVAAFYVTMSTMARHETRRHGLPGHVSNGIQHAYAGAETYWWLRQFGLPASASEKTVLRLGYLNEWVEALLFVRRPDTTRELYKDLQNNFIGILAAQAVETCRTRQASSERLALIGQLAQERLVLWLSDDARVPGLPQPLNVRLAISHFKANQASIRFVTVDAIAMHVAAC
ncbi:MAG: hypothetical protein ACKVP7_06505 [Hyphomicrobiaceae bacterium]